MSDTTDHGRCSHASTEARRLMRSRWAAIGAAVAVAIGAGGAVRLAGAVSGSSAPSSFVSITPVRILDTRDPTNLGLAGPFVSATGQNLQVTGTVPTVAGNATVVPPGATGVMFNVTVVLPTADGFLSVRPAGTPGAPTTSSLNFVAGQIVPNAVFVALPTAGADAGKIEITYDAFGTSGPTTDVLVDVVGYAVESSPPKTLSLPITGAATNNVTFSAAHPGGLRLPDNGFGTYASLDHSFIVPDDYTPGTPIFVEVMWVVGANCRPVLERNNLTVTRPGIPEITGLSTSDGLTMEDTPTATANVVNRTNMTIVSPDPAIPMAPGDTVLFGLFRRGDHPAETCVGPQVVLTGLNVRYE
jgi:hypothetical protein